MVRKITVCKKIVCYRNTRYRLVYRLLKKEHCCYGIEISCTDAHSTEAAHLWIGADYHDTMRMIRLFAEETVFPVALKETWENL